MTRTAGGKTFTQVATGRGGSATTARNFLIFGYTFNSDSCSGGWAGKVSIWSDLELVALWTPLKE